MIELVKQKMLPIESAKILVIASRGAIVPDAESTNFLKTNTLKSPIAALIFAEGHGKSVADCWPACEDLIATDAECAAKYAAYVLQGRFEKGEKAISQSPWASTIYAISATKTRFYQGEGAIASEEATRSAYYEYFKIRLRGENHEN